MGVKSQRLFVTETVIIRKLIISRVCSLGAPIEEGVIVRKTDGGRNRLKQVGLSMKSQMLHASVHCS